MTVFSRFFFDYFHNMNEEVGLSYTVMGLTPQRRKLSLKMGGMTWVKPPSYPSLSCGVRILKARPVFNFSSFTASNNSFIRHLVLERAYLLVCDKTQGSLEERRGEIVFLFFFISEMTLEFCSQVP